jgi:NIPSNAP
VLYRMRIYLAVRDSLAVFHDFFRDYLLPVQLRHGARLVGRWETEDGRVAVWEYDDRAAYERIEVAVRGDPASLRARQRRAELPPLITEQEEVFMSATADLPGLSPDAAPH